MPTSIPPNPTWASSKRRRIASVKTRSSGQTRWRIYCSLNSRNGSRRRAHPHAIHPVTVVSATFRLASSLLSKCDSTAPTIAGANAERAVLAAVLPSAAPTPPHQRGGRSASASPAENPLIKAMVLRLRCSGRCHGSRVFVRSLSAAASSVCAVDTRAATLVGLFTRCAGASA
jgi:hypothetical protein